MTSQPRKTVAIVDDDSSTLKAAETLLDAHGFGTIGFFSAEEFLRSDARTHVDCLLLDIHLGGASGLDLRRWLTKARKAGLDDEAIEALFHTTFRSAAREDIA